MFNLTILEGDTEFKEEVDLDEMENIVTVHVPAHNDVDETFFITDKTKVNYYSLNTLVYMVPRW